MHPRDRRCPAGGGSLPLLVTIAQKREDILYLVREFLAKAGINSRVDTAKFWPNINRKLVGKLCLAGKHAESFLIGVLPYIVVKKVHAQDVLRFRKLYPPMLPNTPARKLLLREGLKRGMDGRIVPKSDA